MFRKAMTLAAAAALLAACSTDPFTGEQKFPTRQSVPHRSTAWHRGGPIIIGQNTSANTRKAMLIGAGVGALTGGGVGLYMDNQEAKLRKRLEGSGVSVTRAGNDIILNMPSNITFDTDQSAIKPRFYDTLNSVAIVLNEFNRTLVDVTGHTDSTGSSSHNQQLSERRAASVAEYLVAQGNNPKRFQVIGMGQTEPVASNSTPEGRAQEPPRRDPHRSADVMTLEPPPRRSWGPAFPGMMEPGDD